MAIVVNSGPLISLARIGLLDLLPKLFDEILIPDAVFREVTQDQRLPGALAVKDADWLKLGAISDREAVVRLSFWLDAGESEVLALAQEIGATAVIDEKRARNLATSLGIPQTGTIGILLAAKRAGAIPEVTPRLDQLMSNGVRVSPRLYEEARRLAGEA